MAVVDPAVDLVATMMGEAQARVCRLRGLLLRCEGVKGSLWRVERCGGGGGGWRVTCERGPEIAVRWAR